MELDEAAAPALHAPAWCCESAGLEIDDLSAAPAGDTTLTAGASIGSWSLESRAKEPCRDVLNLSCAALATSLLRLLSLPKLSTDPVRDSARVSRADSCCSDEASLPSPCAALAALALVIARKSDSIAALPLQWLNAMLFHSAALSL
jgi:hypothetical protein